MLQHASIGPPICHLTTRLSSKLAGQLQKYAAKLAWEALAKFSFYHHRFTASNRDLKGKLHAIMLLSLLPRNH
jgi:hypothetical protein